MIRELLKPQEQIALDHLASFWKKFAGKCVRDFCDDDIRNVRDSVHAIQNIFGCKVASRALPEVFIQFPEKD